jgi:hypothetical protein
VQCWPCASGSHQPFLVICLFLVCVGGDEGRQGTGLDWQAGLSHGGSCSSSSVSEGGGGGGGEEALSGFTVASRSAAWTNGHSSWVHRDASPAVAVAFATDGISTILRPYMGVWRSLRKAGLGLTWLDWGRHC